VFNQKLNHRDTSEQTALV